MAPSHAQVTIIAAGVIIVLMVETPMHEEALETQDFAAIAMPGAGATSVHLAR
jgi:hypothetical protein